jgi:large subunit ribosomal protein L23
MEVHQVIKRLLITEKSTIQREESNKYFFEVDRRANKMEIEKAVEKLFNVKVVDVRVMQVLGKKTRRGRITGQKRSWKKAIVTLVAGNRIEITESA